MCFWTDLIEKNITAFWFFVLFHFLTILWTLLKIGNFWQKLVKNLVIKGFSDPKITIWFFWEGLAPFSPLQTTYPNCLSRKRAHRDKTWITTWKRAHQMGRKRAYLFSRAPPPRFTTPPQQNANTLLSRNFAWKHTLFLKTYPIFENVPIPANRPWKRAY